MCILKKQVILFYWSRIGVFVMVFIQWHVERCTVIRHRYLIAGGLIVSIILNHFIVIMIKYESEEINRILPTFINVNAVHINMQTLKNSKNVTYLMFLFDVY